MFFLTMVKTRSFVQVPTWLRNELADEFVPIPSSIGPDSCYSSEEEDNAENSASRKTSDGSFSFLTQLHDRQDVSINFEIPFSILN